MIRGTKGAALASKIDLERSPLPVDPTWDPERHPYPSYGFRRPVTAQQIEAMAEAEFERLTTGGWRNGPCPDCNVAMADNGACFCTDGRSADAMAAIAAAAADARDEEARQAVLRMCGLA